MLTSDLIRARRRGDELKLTAIKKAERERMVDVARGLVALARERVGSGCTRAELEAGFADVEVEARERKLVAGLRKLLLDRCTFESPDLGEVTPPEIRRALFAEASRKRRELSEVEDFDRGSVVAAVAGELELEPQAVDAHLFADLRSEERLEGLEPLTGEALVAAYEDAQVQAVLLRATRVSATVTFGDARAARRFFHKLKFLRLLHRIESAEESKSYRVEVEGPFAMLRSSTRYGLQLAMLVPTLRQAEAFELEAEVLWGKERTALQFHAKGGEGEGVPEEDRTPDEIAKLRKAFQKLDSPWGVRTATKILELPGVGLCIPDLVFRHEDGRQVYFELLGYWSRDAVWRRVELVEAGLDTPILFAVSDRLRVSEEALPKDAPATLYVFKGVMNAKEILRRLDASP